jgi:hypothetical protein
MGSQLMTPISVVLGAGLVIPIALAQTQPFKRT